jgi:hypothetical protein
MLRTAVVGLSSAELLRHNSQNRNSTINGRARRGGCVERVGAVPPL